MHNRVGDCTVRAIAEAEDRSWEDTYIWLCIYGLMFCDLPSANVVWGEYLKDQGYTRHPIEGLNYTINDFVHDHPEGTYIVGTSGHVVCTKGGAYIDTWDSGDETALFYWHK